MDLHRRTLLEMAAVVLFADEALKPAESESELIGAQQAKLETHPFGTNRIYFQRPTQGLKDLIVGSVELNPHQEPHPPHRHLEEEIMIIADGSGEISINGIRSNVGPGTVMYVTSNYLHGVVNTGSTPMTFYYIKWIAK